MPEDNLEANEFPELIEDWRFVIRHYIDEQGKGIYSWKVVGDPETVALLGALDVAKHQFLEEYFYAPEQEDSGT